MRKLFVIGGMGAGKSSVTHALEHLGLPSLDFDAVARAVRAQPETIEVLTGAFGEDILDTQGSINTAVLAARAFADPAATETLNAIMQPRIERSYREMLADLERQGAPAVVVEYPLFPQEHEKYVEDGDLIVAVTAPYEQRVARAVAKGFDEADVVRRIALQAGDDERAALADVIFANDGTQAELAEQVQAWWQSLSRS